MNIVSALLERRKQRKALAEEKNRLLHDRISRLFADEHAASESAPAEANEEECETVGVGKA